MEQKIRKRFDESVGLIRMAEEHLTTRITQAADLIAGALKSGGTVFLFGNGGSAADAQHFACELVGRFLKDRPPLRAEALAADAATMTSVANDYGYEMIFARQLAGKGRKGDVAVALSTSGDSPNVIAALDKARQIGLATIAMTGSTGGRCAALADVLLDVPSRCTPRVQEAHVVIYHILCELVEEAIVADE